MKKEQVDKQAERWKEWRKKTWAILHKSGRYIEHDGNRHLYIYDKEPAWDTGGRVVEVEISYRFTKKPPHK